MSEARRKEERPAEAAPPLPVVSLQHVGKRYGKRWAIRDISLTILPGEIVGFIGPNGAGKTTLMRLIAGLSPLSEGQMTVMGERLGERELRTPPELGVMLEQMGFLPHWSGRANLEMLAGLRRIADAATIVETLKRVGLDPADRRPVRAYSLGMRQRLSLAQALMERPKLLLLDEPTNGLDPAGIVVLRELLKQVASEGTAIFLASHLLTEVERVCDRVLLVRAGEMLKDIDLRAPGPLRLRVVVSSAKDAEVVLGSGLPAERPPGEAAPCILSLTPDRAVPDLIRELVRMGVDIEEIGQERRSLETEFLSLFA
jgi:ABC-2 type transport system ATP-binding protein